MADRKTMPRRRVWLFNLLLLAGGVLVGLLLFEAGLWLIGYDPGEPFYERHPVRGWSLTPGSSSVFTSASGKRTTVNINDLGFRGAPFLAIKPPRTYRIFAMGCSCTLGINEDGDSTYPGQLQSLLNRDQARRTGLNFEVINAGVAGYCTRQGLQWLRSQIIDYQPDLLTVYYGWNDHWIDSSLLTSLNEEQVNRVKYYAFKLRTVQLLSRMHLHFLEWSARMREQDAAAATAATPAAVAAAGPADTAGIAPVAGDANRDATRVVRVPLAEYERNLTAIIDLARARGVAVVLVTAPMAHTLLPRHTGFTAATAPEMFSGYDTETVTITHHLYTDALRRVGRATNTPVVDLEATFNEMPEAARRRLFEPNDWVHTTAEGYAVIARALADAIGPRIPAAGSVAAPALP